MKKKKKRKNLSAQVQKHSFDFPLIHFENYKYVSVQSYRIVRNQLGASFYEEPVYFKPKIIIKKNEIMFLS